MKKYIINPRRIAYLVLIHYNDKDVFCDDVLNEYLSISPISDADKRLATEITYGVLKNILLLDYYISPLIKQPINKMDEEILTILRMGVYQLIFLERVPEFAIVNEAAAFAKELKGKRIAGFVNAVLRNIIRNRPQVPFPDTDEDFRSYLQIAYSHPKWLVDYLCRTYGENSAQKICEAGNLVAPITLRVNTLRVTRDEFIHQLIEAGIKDVYAGRYSPDAVYIGRIGNLSTQNFLKEGLAVVQDESSQLVGYVIDPRQGETIIDMCSAPGGKAAHIAQLQHDKGRIIAIDIEEERLARVRDAAARLSLRSIEVNLKTDDFIKSLGTEIADKILIDAPCSGLGTIRRRPDLRWKKSPQDIAICAKIQVELLKEAAPLLKPNGIIVYSTCTYAYEENEDVINNFLSNNSNFKIDAISFKKIKNAEEFLTKSGSIKILPYNNELDGFFITQLRKVV